MKTLFFDTETKFVSAEVFYIGSKVRITHEMIRQKESFGIICIGYKWAHETKPQILTWNTKTQDTKAMMRKFAKVVESADVVVAHNCVEINTPVLKADLTWVPAGELKEGDELFGFEEGAEPGQRTRNTSGSWIGLSGKEQRKIQKAKVTHHEIRQVECLKVTLSNGDSVITTPDHYWLAKAEKDQNLRWYATNKLRVGQRIKKYTTPWEMNTDYKAGWLAGFLDGEGSLCVTSKGVPGSIQFCQNDGIIWEKALAVCSALGISHLIPRKKKGAFVNSKGCNYVNTTGGKFELLRILGSIRPIRLLEKINLDNFGSLTSQKAETLTVISVEPAGIQSVAVMSTSTKTFMAAGYAMHNCDAFDVKQVNTQLLINGQPPIAWPKTEDTLKMARSKFYFASNKLDYLGKILVGEGKNPMCMDDWVQIIRHNSQAHLEKMAKYCMQDTLLLEKVYNKLKAFVPPTARVIMDKGKCPRCGSPSHRSKGVYRTAAGAWQLRQCNKCKHSFKGKNITKDMIKEGK